MKWMIASDVHGSAVFCRQLFERYDEEKADRLISESQQDQLN